MFVSETFLTPIAQSGATRSAPLQSPVQTPPRGAPQSAATQSVTKHRSAGSKERYTIRSEVPMKLYHNAFSPFARKVLMVLEHKGLEFELIDGLDKNNRDALAKVNQRVEVPAIDDDGVMVVNSPDIIAYLEHRYPDRPVYPADPATRAHARAWERCADTALDAILVDISYWSWAERPDSMPEGLKEAAQRDLDRIYSALERDLQDNDYVCGELSVADFALFVQLTAVKPLGVSFTAESHPSLLAWFKRVRQIDAFRADVERTRGYLTNLSAINIERQKIFWRGDRIEWVLGAGFHEWFFREIEEGRVIWPGLGVPPPRKSS